MFWPLLKIIIIIHKVEHNSLYLLFIVMIKSLIWKSKFNQYIYKKIYLTDKIVIIKYINKKLYYKPPIWKPN